MFLVSFFFFFLPFPFLMFACFFQTNFPNIPFLKSNLLSFLAVSFFFCCCCFCFHSICFSLSVFLSLCWLCFWCFSFVLFCVLSFLFFLVLLSVYEKKKLFSLQFWCFYWALLVKRVVWFLWFMCLFLFVFLVLFLSSLKNSFVLFCFCVVVFFCHKTKWSFCCILWSFFLFCFLVVCFEFCLFFVFSFL